MEWSGVRNAMSCRQWGKCSLFCAMAMAVLAGLGGMAAPALAVDEGLDADMERPHALPEATVA